MKTYILRTQKTVERQKPPTPLQPAAPVVPTVPGVLAPPDSAPIRRDDPAVRAAVDRLAGSILFVGLDVHQDSIAVSLAPAGSAEVRRYGVIGGTLDDALKLAIPPCGTRPPIPAPAVGDFLRGRFQVSKQRRSGEIGPGRRERRAGTTLCAARRRGWAAKAKGNSDSGSRAGGETDGFRNVRRAGSTPDGKDAARDHHSLPTGHPTRAPVLSILW